MYARNTIIQLYFNGEGGYGRGSGVRPKSSEEEVGPAEEEEEARDERIEMEKQQKKRDINANINGKKERREKNVEIGKEEVLAIRNRFPTKIPIIVQRFSKENNLPQLDKTKFLVPQELTMSQFLTIIRNRMRMKSTQSLYLLVNNRSLISLSLTFAEVYNEHAGPDGFLYVTYASQETFGTSGRFRSTTPLDNVTEMDSTKLLSLI